MPTLRYFFTCIFYMFIPIDFIIYYHSQKLCMANSVYLSPIYINLLIKLLILFLTLGILLNVIVHVFLIFNESLLALSHSEIFCI